MTVALLCGESMEYYGFREPRIMSRPPALVSDWPARLAVPLKQPVTTGLPAGSAPTEYAAAPMLLNCCAQTGPPELEYLARNPSQYMVGEAPGTVSD